MKLKPGKFYVARNGEIWCCFDVPNREEHAAAYCVQVSTRRIEYFFLDGRYDREGQREHTLVREKST